MNTDQSNASTYQSVVAVYETPQAANAARNDLVAAGIPDGDIFVRNKTDAAEVTTQEPSWWEQLFGSDYETIPAEHRNAYYDRIERGQTVLTVRAIDDAGEYQRISGILHAHDPVDLDDSLVGYEHPWSGASYNSGAGAVAPDSTSERVIPVVEEDVHVGKRPVQSAKAYRIRTDVREVPVEEEVKLHDETVTVERRPPTSGVTADGDPFHESTVEVREMHEEPVVEKTARVKEEVVVRKSEHDHVEHVHDTARRTDVDVEETTQSQKAKR